MSDWLAPVKDGPELTAARAILNATIAAAVTPTSTAAAIALIMVDDSGFDLTLP